MVFVDAVAKRPLARTCERASGGKAMYRRPAYFYSRTVAFRGATPQHLRLNKLESPACVSMQNPNRGEWGPVRSFFPVAMLIYPSTTYPKYTPMKIKKNPRGWGQYSAT